MSAAERDRIYKFNAERIEHVAKVAIEGGNAAPVVVVADTRDEDGKKLVAAAHGSERVQQANDSNRDGVFLTAVFDLTPDEAMKLLGEATRSMSQFLSMTAPAGHFHVAVYSLGGFRCIFRRIPD